ncbi:hypothetical protein N9W34_00405 [Rickettsiales bacterium]|nr:hypothetical protein [Rickettsiales bacterium]
MRITKSNYYKKTGITDVHGVFYSTLNCKENRHGSGSEKTAERQTKAAPT